MIFMLTLFISSLTISSYLNCVYINKKQPDIGCLTLWERWIMWPLLDNVVELYKY